MEVPIRASLSGERLRREGYAPPGLSEIVYSDRKKARMHEGRVLIGKIPEPSMPSPESAAVGRIRKAVITSMRAVVEGQQTGRNEFSDPLQVLAWKDGLTLGEIASRMNVELATAEVRRDELESSGLIVREGSGIGAHHLLP